MKRIYLVILFTAILLSCEKPISYFQSENFIKMFGSGYESKGNDVIELSDGGYMLTGYDIIDGNDKQTIVIKVDKNGNEIWTKNFGEGNKSEEGIVLKQIADGYVIAGTSKESNGTITRTFLLKIDAEGNEVFDTLVGSSSYSIVVKDIATSDGNTYVVGQSNSFDVSKTDYYIAKVSPTGGLLWGRPYSVANNCSFEKIFIKEGKLVAVGNDSHADKMAIVPYLTIEGTPDGTVGYIGIANERVVDVSIVGEQLYFLTKGGSSNAKLSKISSNFTEEWHCDPATDFQGKSVVRNDDGTFIICADKVVDEISSVNFIKVNANGAVENSENYFKPFLGTTGKAIQTSDKGLILIGTTNKTYGMNIQLIKTDKDYFMLKNN